MDLTLPRCLTVWLAVTTAAAAVAGWAVVGLDTSASFASFDRLVQVVCVLALVACAAWAWAVASIVILGAMRARGRAAALAPSAAPLWAQRLLLAACGVALVGAVQAAPAGATPAHAPSRDDGLAAVAGLPLPDRTTGPLRHDAGREPSSVDPVVAAVGRVADAIDRRTSVTVEAGDSLWAIAERLLGRDATTAEVATLVSGLYATNRAEIGADPDLIQPGHQLRTPLGERPAR